MAKTTTAKPPSSNRTPACKHKKLLPSGIDTWTCQECGDPLKMTENGVVDSKGRKLKIDPGVLLDGKTGAPKTAPATSRGKNGNAKEPEQIELVRLSTDEIIHNMTLKQAEINVASSEAGRARKRVKDLKDQQQKMIDELIARDALAHNLELPLGGCDDDDDEDD